MVVSSWPVIGGPEKTIFVPSSPPVVEGGSYQVIPLFMRFENHFTRPETWTTVNAEHEAVLDAIMRRDAREARNAMRRHMDNAAKRFNEGFRTSAAPARVRNKAARKAR